MTTANGQTPAPFMQDAPAVISTLGTDAHQGLTSEQAAHNLNQYGPNAFTKPKPESMSAEDIEEAIGDPRVHGRTLGAPVRSRWLRSSWARRHRRSS